jgi:hypothetical protein
MDQPNSNRRIIVIVLVLLPVLYVLSMGPVSRLYWKSSSQGTKHFIEWIYYPLHLIPQDSSLWVPIRRYCDWWL